MKVTLSNGAPANMNIFVAGSRFVMGTQIFAVTLIPEKYLPFEMRWIRNQSLHFVGIHDFSYLTAHDMSYVFHQDFIIQSAE